MKKILFIILLNILPFGKAWLGCNAQSIIDRISHSAAAVKTIQCDFVQTKKMKMLGDKMVSKGKMYYQAPTLKGKAGGEALHWEYLTPYQYTFILNDDKVLLKKGDRRDVIDVKKNKMFKEIASIMMSSVVGNCLTDKKSFSVTASENTESYVCTLVPQKKELKQMFTKFVLTFSKKTNMVSKVQMFEKNGDSTDIVLKNISTNKTIPASVFSI